MSKVCAICHSPIQPGTKYKTTNVQNFHRECFKCSNCNRLLEQEYYEQNGRFYCAKDYNDLFAPKCDKCFKGISEEHVQYRGKKFHNNCFTCLKCHNRVSIDNFFRVEDKGPYCDPCADQLTGHGHHGGGGHHGGFHDHAGHAGSHGGGHGGAHGGAHGGGHGDAHFGGGHGGSHGGSHGNDHGGAHIGIHAGGHGSHGGGHVDVSHSHKGHDHDDHHDHGHIGSEKAVEVRLNSKSKSGSSSSSDDNKAGLEQAQAELDELLNGM
eukprot:TRINITY_DN532_c0_g1_i1.p1 TRINITY_DN532_c0_g1~~TRINITY_DN532_c0_g1_i1.p1  ORF type:complete len:277 (+),score=46.43 TRINITY_DN532_c0_g1_i1:34-831(+)